MSEWNFEPDIIQAAREIGIGDRVRVHWSEAECQDQDATVIGVQIERYGRPSYSLHIDGDSSPTDGFYHDRSGHDAGSISLLSRAASPSPSMEMGVVATSWVYMGKVRCAHDVAFSPSDIDRGIVSEVTPLVTLSSAQSALATAEAQVQRLTEENEALRKERDEAVSIVRNVTQALVDLTPSGSEYFSHSALLDCYYADTEACTRAVRDRFDSGHKAKIERVDERRRAEAAEARIKALEEALRPVGTIALGILAEAPANADKVKVFTDSSEVPHYLSLDACRLICSALKENAL